MKKSYTEWERKGEWGRRLSSFHVEYTESAHILPSHLLSHLLLSFSLLSLLLSLEVFKIDDVKSRVLFQLKTLYPPNEMEVSIPSQPITFFSIPVLLSVLL